MSSSFVLRASINLTATAVSSTQVDLTWADNSTNESGFKIERSTNNINFTQITTVGQNATSYSDTGLQSTSFCYRVKAYNTAGDSGYSNVAASNMWIKKADFGGSARRVAVGFSIGNKGYIGTGYDGTNLLKDFWEYDPSNDAWTQKADLPDSAPARSQAVGFSIGNKGYIGTGYDGTLLNDFWEYDP